MVHYGIYRHFVAFIFRAMTMDKSNARGSNTKGRFLTRIEPNGETTVKGINTREISRKSLNLTVFILNVSPIFF